MLQSNRWGENRCSVRLHDAGDNALIARLRERAGDLSDAGTEADGFDQAVGVMSAAELRLGVESAASALAGLVASIQSGSPIEPRCTSASGRSRRTCPRLRRRRCPHPRRRRPSTAWKRNSPSAAGLSAPRRPGGGRRRLRSRCRPPLADQLLAAYRDLRSSPPSEAEDDEWPEGLLPLLTVDDVPFRRLDAATGRVLEADYAEIEADGDVTFRLTLSEIAASLQACSRAADAAPVLPPPAAMLHDFMVEAARASRARIAARRPSSAPHWVCPSTAGSRSCGAGSGSSPARLRDRR